MVGIIALVDCLGPKVLKGLAIITGKPKDFWNDIPKLSAAILLAEYEARTNRVRR